MTSYRRLDRFYLSIDYFRENANSCRMTKGKWGKPLRKKIIQCNENVLSYCNLKCILFRLSILFLLLLGC